MTLPFGWGSVWQWLFAHVFHHPTVGHTFKGNPTHQMDDPYFFHHKFHEHFLTWEHVPPKDGVKWAKIWSLSDWYVTRIKLWKPKPRIINETSQYWIQMLALCIMLDCQSFPIIKAESVKRRRKDDVVVFLLDGIILDTVCIAYQLLCI